MREYSFASQAAEGATDQAFEWIARVIQGKKDVETLRTWLQGAVAYDKQIFIDTEFASRIAGGRDLISIQFGVEGSTTTFFLPIRQYNRMTGRRLTGFFGKQTPEQIEETVSGILKGVPRGGKYTFQNAPADLPFMHRIGLAVDPLKDEIDDTMALAYLKGYKSAALKTMGREWGWTEPDLGDVLSQTRATYPGGYGRTAEFLGLGPGKGGRPSFIRYATGDIVLTKRARQELAGVVRPRGFNKLQAQIMQRSLAGVEDPWVEMTRDIGLSPDREARVGEYLKFLATQEGQGAIPAEFVREGLGYRISQGMLAYNVSPAIKGPYAETVAAARRGFATRVSSSKYPPYFTREDISSFMGNVQTGTVRDAFRTFRRGMVDRAASARDIRGEVLGEVMDVIAGKGNPAVLGLTPEEAKLWEITRTNIQAPVYQRVPITEHLSTAMRQIAAGKTSEEMARLTGTLQISPVTKVLRPISEIERIEGKLGELAQRQLEVAFDAIERGMQVPDKDILRHVGLTIRHANYSLAKEAGVRGPADVVFRMGRGESLVNTVYAKERAVLDQFVGRLGEIKNLEGLDDAGREVLRHGVFEEYAQHVRGYHPGWWKRTWDVAGMQRYNQLVEAGRLGPGKMLHINLARLPEATDDLSNYMVDLLYRAADSDEAVKVARMAIPREALEYMRKLYTEKGVESVPYYMTAATTGELGGASDDIFSVLASELSNVGSKAGINKALQGPRVYPSGRVLGIPALAEHPGLEGAARNIQMVYEEVTGKGMDMDDQMNLVRGMISSVPKDASMANEAAIAAGDKFSRWFLPAAAGALILGVGINHVLSSRRASEAWTRPSRIFGDYTEPGVQRMQEQRETVDTQMSQGVPSRHRTGGVWDTSDIVSILGLNRIRHWNMDHAKNSYLYGGMAGRV